MPGNQPSVICQPRFYAPLERFSDIGESYLFIFNSEDFRYVRSEGAMLLPARQFSGYRIHNSYQSMPIERHGGGTVGIRQMGEPSFPVEGLLFRGTPAQGNID